MPAKSKRQFGLLGAACAGKKTKAEISREKACEFIRGQSPKNLPERVSKGRSGSAHNSVSSRPGVVWRT